jgi:tetratricopeptide (TPR) repeat protein
MEGALHKLAAELQGRLDRDTPLDRAQAIVYRAFEERHAQRRIQMAKEALAISPDCADALVLLAEHTRSRREALSFYEQAVAAGERAMGPESFQRDAGHFWGVMPTRPYMRARLGLAHALWNAGNRAEAVQHLQDMLRLNPNDNQGVRYALAGYLLFLDRDDDLARLLEQYSSEDSTTWVYTQALLAFRRQGDTIEARQLLKRAKKANKHIPAYLLGEKRPPADPPASYRAGDENEALTYIGSFLAGWKFTTGAIAWLRANVKARKEKESPPPKGPLGVIKNWLKGRLSQEQDVWQADARQMPAWIRIAGEMVRPWALLVTSRSNDLILAHEMPDMAPSAEHLWDALVKGMQHPLAGHPHRPTELQVRGDERWRSLQSHVEEIGIEFVVKDGLDQLDFMFVEMVEHVCGKPRPGLLDIPGLTPEAVGRFHEAAAAFFRRAPWKKVGYEAPIKIECDEFQSGPWYAVLMGLSGLTLGVSLYDDPQALHGLWTGEPFSEESTREAVTTSVIFGEKWDIPVADLEAATEHGWEVAQPDAFPAVFRKERGISIRPPLAWELELLEGCLRALPEFVERRKQDDSAREELKVSTASGELRLALSWQAKQG